METVLEIKKIKKSFRNYENKITPIVDIDHFVLGSKEQVGVEGFDRFLKFAESRIWSIDIAITHAKTFLLLTYLLTYLLSSTYLLLKI